MIKEIMHIVKAKIIGFLNGFLYFTPILLANYRWRKYLRVLYCRNNEDMKENEVPPVTNSFKSVVYMALSETTFSGGLSDRLRGIVAIYSECKRMGLPFRIVFEPLHLEDYLSPNQYDWRINNDEICWNTSRVYPCVILTYHNNSRNIWQRFVQHAILAHFLKKPYKQIHVYSNMFCSDSEYTSLFRELFKPTRELRKLIVYHLEQLGGAGNYVSATFRFRQLLGDFKEGGAVLPEKERMPYIEKCIKAIERLHERVPEKKILVTADSHTFLEMLVKKRMPYVYVMPGRVVHIGFTANASKKTYMKSFLDMYMLSYASTVFLVRDKIMYHSGFPYRASLLNGTKYGEISLQS